MRRMITVSLLYAERARVPGEARHVNFLGKGLPVSLQSSLHFTHRCYTPLYTLYTLFNNTSYYSLLRHTTHLYEWHTCWYDVCCNAWKSPCLYAQRGLESLVRLDMKFPRVGCFCLLLHVCECVRTFAGEHSGIRVYIYCICTLCSHFHTLYSSIRYVPHIYVDT